MQGTAMVGVARDIAVAPDQDGSLDVDIHNRWGHHRTMAGTPPQARLVALLSVHLCFEPQGNLMGSPPSAVFQHITRPHQDAVEHMPETVTLAALDTKMVAPK